MTTTERWQWIVDVVTQTGSLLFLWHGSMGTQPVLMPGFPYYWWLDDDSATALYQDTASRSGRSGAELVN